VVPFDCAQGKLWGVKTARGGRDFGGEFGPPEADGVKKCAKTYVKKPKMRANAHEIYLAVPKMNAERWLIEEFKFGWVKDKNG